MSDIEKALREAKLWKSRVQLTPEQVAEVVALIDSGRRNVGGEGMPEAEILRRWKIVDAMIEELDEERADREETLKQLRRELDTGNFFWIDAISKFLAEQNDKIFKLENWLKIGAEDDEGAT